MTTTTSASPIPPISATSFFAAIFLAGLLSCSCSCLLAQDDFEDEPPEFLPGLIAHYSSPGVDFTRVDGDVWFDRKITSKDPRLAQADSVAANWTGLLQVRESGSFHLHVYARGSVQLSIDGKQILNGQAKEAKWLEAEPIELRFGRHAFDLRFEGAENPQIGVYWSGPSFQREPITAMYFSHPAKSTPTVEFELGQQLSVALRCGACHDFGTSEAPLPAPSLTHLQDNLRPSWLVEHLTKDDRSSADLSSRRMPLFGLERNSANSIAAALFAASEVSNLPVDHRSELEAIEAKRKNKDPEIRMTGNVEAGAVVFASIGCLACHQVGSLGAVAEPTQGLYSGGDLSQISAKRTKAFFSRWLDNPAQINPHHRMPKFDLSPLEHLDLVEFLFSLGIDDSRNDTKAHGDVNLGRGLIDQHRCAACHELPASLTTNLPIATKAETTSKRTRITDQSDWQAGCLSSADAKSALPGFGLSHLQINALRTYYREVPKQKAAHPSGEQLLKQNNCLACHSRDLAPGIATHLPSVAATHPETASRLAALSPPSITGIGDKLTDRGLEDAILRKSPPLRPWLDVRMPTFQFSNEQLSALTSYLIGHDRIPSFEKEQNTTSEAQSMGASDAASEFAAARLVTADGFGCQSCHAIGEMESPQVDLKARGTNLAMLGDRIRPSWFYRWVSNPSRIVPRMEMPAIQMAAKGILDENLQLQLEAVWKTLNTPGFRPPRPNPVRVVRAYHEGNTNASANVVTSVLETPDQTYLRPLIIGLPNRQNVIFDLEDGNLAAWWLGDTARQHTRGKTWFWEPGSEPLNDPTATLQSFCIVDAAGNRWQPTRDGQVAIKLDAIEHIPGGVAWQGRLHLTHGGAFREVPIAFRVTASEDATVIESKFDVEPGEQVAIFSPVANAADANLDHLPIGKHTQVALASSEDEWSIAGERAGERFLADGQSADGQVCWTSSLTSNLPADTFPRPPELNIEFPIRELAVVPGYEAIQLPLPFDEMPISFAWGPQGQFYSGSLKGHVLQILDTNVDGLPDTYQRISDEIPTPYGLHFDNGGLDVLAKFALLRLTPPKMDNNPTGSEVWNSTVLADGWGYSKDYHDWAIGLKRDSEGNYLIALPCQQDDRPEAAAVYRGHALKLIPNGDSAESSRAYRIESIAAGLRFPMGIALSKSGDLFATDNQGNYNPFNELNHIRYGKRYGFINKLENKDGFSPPFESPAINLPHPWSRSVNGVCFLYTPDNQTESMYGPFEGHLIGCEMNERSLVRMSLQKVGDTYQGAAYAFSRQPIDGEATFEGPIVCELSPEGDLYVGNLHDSGWGGGNNTGSIVRLRPSGPLPLGIAEVRATPTGLTIDFTEAVDASQAKKLQNYQVRSYRRVSTPAYGGDDQDERTEIAKSIAISDNRRRVTLEFEQLREGCVYELNLGDLAPDGQPLFPSQAHYHMRSIPTP